jgi:hypothetical protein
VQFYGGIHLWEIRDIILKVRMKTSSDGCWLGALPGFKRAFVALYGCVNSL